MGSCYCLVGSLQFSSSTVKQTSEQTPISEMFLTFYDKNCETALQGASAYRRREFWRETHTPLSPLIGRIIFLTRDLIGRIIFSTCETIVYSSD